MARSGEEGEGAVELLKYWLHGRDNGVENWAISCIYEI